MTAPTGGFYSASDADSNGGEGRFFLWTVEQIRSALLPKLAELTIDVFGVTATGNFEHANILHLPVALREFATRRDIATAELLTPLADIREALYTRRAQRMHPERDEKIVTAWNGMMIVALAEAAAILNEPRYQAAALRATVSLWDSRQTTGELRRVHLDGQSSVPALQEDYAWLADGFVHLYDITGATAWLERAELLTATMNRLFWDEKSGGYFMNVAVTEAGGVATMTRPKHGTDSAVPSGNAAALHVLAKLERRTGARIYRQTANALLAIYSSSINRSPTAYSYMLRAAQLLADGGAGPFQYAARGAISVRAHIDEATLVVDLAIDPGWHINAHETLQEDLIPTSLGLHGSVAGWRSTTASYPEPLLKTLGFQSEKLALFEGQVRITMGLQQTDSDARPLIPIVLRLQACDDSVCLPPEQRILRVPTKRHQIEPA
jgi:uncharacterized protein YyaL (SSP411 family)